MIRIAGASKSFALPGGGRFDAVRDVSLDVNEGDIFGLIGKSGAGKSTLLRLINLLERPDSGTIAVDGRELTALSKRELRDARQNIGMIFQQFNLLQNATVFDNVAFPLRIHGALNAPRMTARVHAMPGPGRAGRQGATAIRRNCPAARSSAWRSPARWPAGPAVLLCDEPTSALDAETTRALLDTLRDINRAWASPSSSSATNCRCWAPSATASP